MAEREILDLWLDGQAVSVPRGTTVAALLMGRRSSWRRSVSGQPRGPLCGMGICFECRVRIDEQADRLACQVLCRDGMRILTNGATAPEDSR